MSLSAEQETRFNVARLITDALQIEGHRVHSWSGRDGQIVKAEVGGRSVTITIKCHRKSHDERAQLSPSLKEGTR